LLGRVQLESARDRNLNRGSPANKVVVQEFYDQWNSGAIDFERIADERIAEHRVVRDDLGMLLQTGAIAASA
jgi:hypothetical protein